VCGWRCKDERRGVKKSVFAWVGVEGVENGLGGGKKGDRVKDKGKKGGGVGGGEGEKRKKARGPVCVSFVRSFVARRAGGGKGLCAVRRRSTAAADRWRECTGTAAELSVVSLGPPPVSVARRSFSSVVTDCTRGVDARVPFVVSVRDRRRCRVVFACVCVCVCVCFCRRSRCPTTTRKIIIVAETIAS